MKRYLVPILLLVAAFISFYIGLVMGLIYNPTIGSLLWLLAGILTVFAIFQIVKMNGNQQE